MELFRQPRPDSHRGTGESSSTAHAGLHGETQFVQDHRRVIDGFHRLFGSGAGVPGGISIAGHQCQILDLVGAIRDNRSPLIDGREGRKAVSLVHAIYKSAKSGQPVSLV